MKLFWSVIGVFLLAAVAVVWLQTAESGQAERFAQAPSPEQSQPLDRRSAVTPAEPVAQDDAADLEQSDASEHRNDTDAESAGEGLRRLFGADGESESDVSPQQELVNDLLGTERDEPPVAITRSGPAPGSGDGRAHAPPGQEAQQAENPWVDGEAPAILEHTVETRNDGTIVLDGLFEMKGEGTATNPYEITWDLLMSAAETYQPRLGMSDIPERIQMLDGKYVKITGYLLFPMASRQADEVLVMLNVWDGCCLGTMPSPYDAIEVDLKEPVDASGRQFMNYGTLEGRLNVDPYLINDWLIGLYIIEDGTLRLGSM